MPFHTRESRRRTIQSVRKRIAEGAERRRQRGRERVELRDIEREADIQEARRQARLTGVARARLEGERARVRAKRPRGFLAGLRGAGESISGLRQSIGGTGGVESAFGGGPRRRRKGRDPIEELFG